MTRDTLNRTVAAVLAAAIGATLERVFGPTYEIAAVVAVVGLVVVAVRAWRDRRRTFPPAIEPVWAVASLEVDGSPCRGAPASRARVGGREGRGEAFACRPGDIDESGGVG